MDIVDFIRQFIFELSVQLKASNLYLTIFAALLGAVVGVLLTIFVSLLSGFLNKLSYNKSARMQIHDLTESNIMRCQVNIGVLDNEIDGLSSRGKFTLNGLALLQDYENTLLYTPAKFRDIEIRKASQGEQEWELTGLRLEYDRHLKNKFSEIQEFTKALRDYIDLGCLKRFFMNFIPLRVIQKKSMEVVMGTPTQTN